MEGKATILTRNGETVYLLGKPLYMSRFNPDEKKALFQAIDELNSASVQYPVSELLAGITTFQLRNSDYGSSYLRFGKFTSSLFPDGVKMETEADWNAFGVLVQVVSKLIRLAETWDNPGSERSQDSNHDLMVYSAILKECMAIRIKERENGGEAEWDVKKRPDLKTLEELAAEGHFGQNGKDFAGWTYPDEARAAAETFARERRLKAEGESEGSSLT